jgi:uncharacterized membrane protein
MLTMDNKRILTRNLIRKKRIEEIDLLRGIPIFLVVLYHFCWSFNELPYLFSNVGEMLVRYPNIQDFLIFLNNDILGGKNTFIQDYVVPSIGGLFIFVCGISCILSRSNVKRCLLLWLVSLAISTGTFLVTYISGADCYIDWGVIHLMAFSVTVYAILEAICHKFHKQVPIWLCLTIAGLIFISSLFLYLGFNPFTFSHFTPWYTKVISGIPPKRYDSISGFFLQVCGKYAGAIDWWPILPYTGVFFLGAALGKMLYGKKKESKFPRMKSLYIFRPLCFIGRHTIWVYVLHQPVIIVVLFIIFSIMGFRL